MLRAMEEGDKVPTIELYPHLAPGVAQLVITSGVDKLFCGVKLTHWDLEVQSWFSRVDVEVSCSGSYTSYSQAEEKIRTGGTCLCYIEMDGVEINSRLYAKLLSLEGELFNVVVIDSDYRLPLCRAVKSEVTLKILPAKPTLYAIRLKLEAVTGY